METCQRCQSVLPRTADVCQVCGTPVGLVASHETDAHAPWRSGQSSRAATISADDFLNDLLDSSPTGAPRSGVEALQPSGESDRQDPGPSDPVENSFSPNDWRLEPLAEQATDRSNERVGDPFDMTAAELAAMVPPPPTAHPEATVDPQDAFRAPWQDRGTDAFSADPDLNDPVLNDPVLNDPVLNDPVLNDPVSSGAPTVGDGLVDTTAVPAERDPRSADQPPTPTDTSDWSESGPAIRPRRTGHDGARPALESGSYSPVPERPIDSPLDELPARQVQAFSTRVDADIKLGPSPNHQLATISMTLLALLTFLLGVGAVLALEPERSAALDRVPVAPLASTDGEPLATEVDPAAVLDRVRPGLVSVTMAGPACDGTNVVVGGVRFPTDHIFVAPIDYRPVSTEVVVTTADGDLPGRIIGWGTDQRLALIQLTAPSASVAPVWASANSAPSGSQVIMLELRGTEWVAGSARSVGSVRSRSGTYATIQLSSGPLHEGAIAVNVDGGIVGIVKPGQHTSITASDELRSSVGRFLVDATWVPAPCPIADPAAGDPATESGN